MIEVFRNAVFSGRIDDDDKEAMDLIEKSGSVNSFIPFPNNEATDPGGIICKAHRGRGKVPDEALGSLYFETRANLGIGLESFCFHLHYFLHNTGSSLRLLPRLLEVKNAKREDIGRFRYDWPKLLSQKDFYEDMIQAETFLTEPAASGNSRYWAHCTTLEQKYNPHIRDSRECYRSPAPGYLSGNTLFNVGFSRDLDAMEHGFNLGNFTSTLRESYANDFRFCVVTDRHTIYALDNDSVLHRHRFFTETDQSDRLREKLSRISEGEIIDKNEIPPVVLWWAVVYALDELLLYCSNTIFADAVRDYKNQAIKILNSTESPGLPENLSMEFYPLATYLKIFLAALFYGGVKVEN